MSRRAFGEGATLQRPKPALPDDMRGSRLGALKLEDVDDRFSLTDGDVLLKLDGIGDDRKNASFRRFDDVKRT